MNNRVNFNRRSSNRRSPNRRSGRQHFRNKKVGKERFQYSIFTNNNLKYLSIIIIIIVVGIIFIKKHLDNKCNEFIINLEYNFDLEDSLFKSYCIKYNKSNITNTD